MITGGLHRQQPLARVDGRHFAEYAVLEIHRREQIAVRKQHFRLAEKQKSGVVQCEVETGDDPRLRFGIEIHQRIAADEKVHTRYRRILDEVEAAEDHRAAELGLDGEPVRVRAFEIFRAKLRRHRRDRLFGVNAVTRLR